MVVTLKSHFFPHSALTQEGKILECQVAQATKFCAVAPKLVDLQYGTCVVSPFLLTFLLIPWSRVLLEKLTGSAASQETPRIFGTRRFITVLTSARYLSLS